MPKGDPQGQPLPPIPAKRYFTIGEVSELCGVKPHVLRYWEQEFTQLKPVKRRGNRRYYQHHEVLLIRRIRELLYEQGFTINGARNRLDVRGEAKQSGAQATDLHDDGHASPAVWRTGHDAALGTAPDFHAVADAPVGAVPADIVAIRDELIAIAALLRP